MTISINLNLHSYERENLLDEITDVKTESLIKYYPMVSSILDKIKETIKQDLLNNPEVTHVKR